MKKLLTILLTMCSVFTLKSQEQTYTQMFDSVFQYVSRADATTGILYNRVLPFSGFSKGYCNDYQKDTANTDMFYQAYMEMYNASFISTNALPFNNDSLEYLANQNINIVNIGFLHFNYNLFNDSVAMQKLYFDADSILRGRCEQSQFFISRDDILNDLQQNSDFLTFFSIYFKNYCTFAL